MSKKLAVIDLGTNFVKVLAGEVDQNSYHFLYEDKIPLPFSQESVNNTELSNDERKVILEVFKGIKKKLFQNKIKHVVTKATSLFRKASNAKEIITYIEHQCKLKIEIIPGNEEADLIHLGIVASMPLQEETAMVLDIGGGSLEVVLFNHQQKLWNRSFEVGVNMIFNRFSVRGLLGNDEISRLEDYYLTLLSPLFSKASIYKPTRLIGTSGAFRTFREIYYAIHPSKEDDKKVIFSREDLFLYPKCDSF